MLEQDSNELHFDWIESSQKELAVIINAGNEDKAQAIMLDSKLIPMLEKLVVKAKTSDAL